MDISIEIDPFRNKQGPFWFLRGPFRPKWSIPVIIVTALKTKTLFDLRVLQIIFSDIVTQEPHKNDTQLHDGTPSS